MCYHCVIYVTTVLYMLPLCDSVYVLLLLLLLVLDLCGYSFSEKYVVALQQMGLPKDNEKINQTFVTFTVCHRLFMCIVDYVIVRVNVCIVYPCRNYHYHCSIVYGSCMGNSVHIISHDVIKSCTYITLYCCVHNCPSACVYLET